jgi:hypothetical protein
VDMIELPATRVDIPAWRHCRRYGPARAGSLWIKPSSRRPY